MKSYVEGTQVRIECTFESVTGAVGDPTTVALIVENPSEEKTTYVYGVDAEVVKTATGIYYADLTLDEPGTWHYRFTGTGALVAAGQGSLVCQAAVPA